LQENYFPEASPVSIETDVGVIRGRRVDRSTVELALLPITTEVTDLRQKKKKNLMI
jgi:hypothetical protein